jgi:type IV secretory pathway VirB4 component
MTPKNRHQTRHAASLFAPAAENRRMRRRRRRAQRRLLRADAQVRPRNHDPSDEAPVHPSYGERRPEALRAPGLRVQAHRATSAVLGHAYPFLAEGGLGSEGTYVGTDVFSGGAFTFDPWVLYGHGLITNPNALIAGVVGTGKSALAKSLACRSIALGRRVYVPSDAKGEWTAVARAVGGTAIELGHGLTARLNPLDPGPQDHRLDDAVWQRTVWSRRRTLIGRLSESMLGRALAPTEHTALDLALATACQQHSTPTLPHVVETLFEPDHRRAGEAGFDPDLLAADARQLAHALRRMVRGDLAGVFDGPSTTAFDPAQPMVTLDLSRLATGGNEHAVRVALTCASAWMEAALTNVSEGTHEEGPAGAQRWVIYDEAWRLMRDPALLARMQEQWKLSRALGIANLMVIHRLSDLDAVGDTGSEARALAEGLLADCSTRIMLRQEADQLRHTAALLDLTDVEQQVIGRLPQGRALWRIGRRSFVVAHRLHEQESHLFDTNAAMSAPAGT